MRGFRNLDGITHYLYNNGTAVHRYINNWINCSTILRNVGSARHGFGAPKSAELLHYAFGSVGRSCTKQNPTLNYKADYIEHRFEARALLPPICDALRNRLFCFHKISDTELTPWNRCRFQNWMTVWMGIWLCDDMSEATPGWESRAGTTFG